MDRRYFHGIRTAAAMSLARCATEELDWLGLYQLDKAFQHFYCFPNSSMTRSNDFSDRTSYIVQCAIPRALATIRDRHGRAPLQVKHFFADKLKFNDNSNNPVSGTLCLYDSVTILKHKFPVAVLQVHVVDLTHDENTFAVISLIHHVGILMTLDCSTM